MTTAEEASRVVQEDGNECLLLCVNAKNKSGDIRPNPCFIPLTDHKINSISR